MGIQNGARVLVVRGRHSGTSGAVFWTGPDRFRGGARLGVRTDRGSTYWVHESEVEAAKTASTLTFGPPFKQYDQICVRYRGKLYNAQVAWTAALASEAGRRVGLDLPGSDAPTWLNTQELAPIGLLPMPAAPDAIPTGLAACMLALESRHAAERIAGQAGLLRLPEAVRLRSADGVRVNDTDALVCEPHTRQHADAAAGEPPPEADGLLRWVGLDNLSYRLNTAVAVARAAGLLRRSALRLCDHRALDLTALSGMAGLHALEVSHALRLRRIVLDLPELRQLVLSGVTSLIGVPGLEQAAALEELGIYGAPSLCFLPELAPLTALRDLTLDRCGLRSIGALRELPLRTLALFRCTAVSDAEAVLPTLRQLRSLLLREHLPLRAIPDLSEMAALTTLEARTLGGLSDLSGFQTPPPALETLALEDCQMLTDISPLASLKTVRRLSLADNPQISDFSVLSELPDLRALDLAGCAALLDRRPLQAMTQLTQARLSYGPDLPVHNRDAFPALQPPPQPATAERPPAKLTAKEQKTLTRLRQALKAPDPDTRASGYELLGALDNPALTQELARGVSVDANGTIILDASARRRAHLRSPELRSWSALQVLRADGALEQVTILDVPELADLSVLAGLPALRHLRVQLLPDADLSALRTLPALTELVIIGTGRPEPLDLRPLSALTALRRLALHRLRTPPDLTPLRALRTVEELDLSLKSATSHPLDLRFLKGMSNLQRLWLDNRASLKNLETMASLPNLRKLSLSSSATESLAPLKGCTQLEELWMPGAKQLLDLRAVLALPRLRLLRM